MPVNLLTPARRPPNTPPARPLTDAEITDRMIDIIGEATDAGRPTTLDDFARAGIPRERAEALIGEAAGAYLARQTAREKARRIA